MAKHNQELVAGHVLTGSAGRVAALLAARGQTLAVVETAAGGSISAALLAISGASAWFLGAAVAYSAAAKEAWLGLPPEAFTPHGVASTHAAAMMAQAVQQVLGATWGLAESGIAGPQTGRRSAKPAGSLYLAVAGPTSTTRDLQTGLASRPANQNAFAVAALHLLEEILQPAPRAGGDG